MKIAYFTPAHFGDLGVLGGGERYPQTLAAGVAEASGGSCTVEIISYGPKALRRRLSPGVWLRVLQAAGRPVNPLDAVSWDIPRTVAEFDLIHAHQIYTRSTEMVAVCARQRGKPLAMTDHGGFWSELGHQVELLELADLLVCQSDFAASHLRTPRPIRVIKGGVDTRFFRPAPEPSRGGYVLYVGRLLPQKGIDTLIEAVPDDLPLKVCGRPYHTEFYEHVRSVAAGKRVEFITRADDWTIRELYRGAVATVLPSTYRDTYGNDYLMPELMGSSLLEAMACGTPTVCTRVGGMPEFVTDGETGFLVDTASDLAGVLTDLADRPDEVERVGRNARREVTASFDRRDVGSRLLDVYRSMLPAYAEVA